MVFDQAPCAYEQTYWAELVNALDEEEIDEQDVEDLPDFMFLDSEQGLFNIKQTEPGDEGTYFVRISS